MRKNTIGVRHILEGGIRILEGETFEHSRKVYILSAIRRFLEEAEKGATFARDRACMVPPSEKASFASYSFLDTYLPDAIDLNEKLPVAKQSFEELERNQIVGPDRLSETAEFLKRLLNSLRTERLLFASERNN